MKNYSEDDITLIQQYETAQLNSANERHTDAISRFEEVKSDYDRWADGTLSKKVACVRIEFGRWVGGVFLLGGSILLNCVLVQEITPDLIALIERMPLIPRSLAALVATGLLTGMLFGILFAVKRVSNLTPELAALRPGLHPAVARPLRNRVSQKVLIKLAYLALLAVGYYKLYHYISGGVALEQAGLESQREMESLLSSSLGDANLSTPNLDQVIASSQAASFAVYYSMEWLLHAVILFVGSTCFPAGSFDLLRLSRRRDEGIFRQAKRELTSASRALAILCQERTPDDGVNSLRKRYLAAIKPEGADPGAAGGTSKPIQNGQCRSVLLSA